VRFAFRGSQRAEAAGGVRGDPQRVESARGPPRNHRQRRVRVPAGEGAMTKKMLHKEPNRHCATNSYLSFSQSILALFNLSDCFACFSRFPLFFSLRPLAMAKRMSPTWCRTVSTSWATLRSLKPRGTPPSSRRCARSCPSRPRTRKTTSLASPRRKKASFTTRARNWASAPVSWTRRTQLPRKCILTGPRHRQSCATQPKLRPLSALSITFSKKASRLDELPAEVLHRDYFEM